MFMERGNLKTHGNGFIYSTKFVLSPEGLVSVAGKQRDFTLSKCGQLRRV